MNKGRKIHDLIALGEGFSTEFKRSGTSNLGRELCAFANAMGGTVLIGVSDKGEVVGVKDANRLKSEVQSLARSIDPPLVVDIELVDQVGNELGSCALMLAWMLLLLKSMKIGLQ